MWLDVWVHLWLYAWKCDWDCVWKCLSKCDKLSAGVVHKKAEVNQFQNMQVTHQFPLTQWVPRKEVESEIACCMLLCIRYSVFFKRMLCILYFSQIDLVQDLSLSGGIFGIQRGLFGSLPFNSFSPVPNDKLDFAVLQFKSLTVQLFDSLAV